MLNFDETDSSESPHTGAAPVGINHLPMGLLQAVLNQVDYGLAVVDAKTHRLIFANAQAKSALQPSSSSKQTGGLCLTHGHLHARNPQHAESLHTALAKTATRVRGLLRLGSGGEAELTVAVMPLAGFTVSETAANSQATATPDSDDDEYDYVDAADATAQESSLALLVFAKQQMCDTTMVTLFARESGLTSAEGQVLAQVCKGLRPAQIATHQGVQVSTVRTQLRAIRHKTASDSMRELVRKVSTLPPLARYLPSFLGSADSGIAA